MNGMAQYPDKYFDLAVVDPPYGASCYLVGGSSINGTNGWSGMVRKTGDWNKEPNKSYFDALFRISKNQIIWGANHFIDLIPYRYSCFLIWDKGQRGFSLADGEMAWTSFKTSARFFGYSRSKALQEGKIHPTQKPIALYSWIYHNYLPKGGKVIDTHLGPGSNRIAAHKAGNIDFVGYEIDKEYFEAQEKRYKEFINQMVLF